MVDCALPQRSMFHENLGKKAKKTLTQLKKVLDCSQKIFLNKSSLMNRKHYVKRKAKGRNCD